MITILIDHNMEGQAELLLDTIVTEGWYDLLPIQMNMFVDVMLKPDASDREIWRFAQANEMIMLTNNRNDDDDNSLERTIREENTQQSLPVLTIGNLGRMTERTYREKCAERLYEILIDLDKYLGAARIFIP